MKRILLIKFMLVVGFMTLITVATALAGGDASLLGDPVVTSTCIPDIAGGKI